MIDVKVTEGSLFNNVKNKCTMHCRSLQRQKKSEKVKSVIFKRHNITFIAQWELTINATVYTMRFQTL